MTALKARQIWDILDHKANIIPDFEKKLGEGVFGKGDVIALNLAAHIDGDLDVPEGDVFKLIEYVETWLDTAGLLTRINAL